MGVMYRGTGLFLFLTTTAASDVWLIAVNFGLGLHVAACGCRLCRRVRDCVRRKYVCLDLEIWNREEGRISKGSQFSLGVDGCGLAFGGPRSPLMGVCRRP